jgi:predicted dehydrogenase
VKKLNIGLIGYKFMGKTHSYAIGNAKFFFKDIEEPVKKVICGRTEHLVKQAAKDFGWEEYCTDWKEVVNRDDIDVVDIVTPTINHMEIAVEAAKSGKHVFCEKPLAMNAREARVMLNTAEKYKIKHMVGYNYRKVPAIGLAKKLISDGKLGEIYHFRGCYLQDWIMDPEFPAIWKLDKKIAGSGPHGDLNAHIIDLARYLDGEIDKVVGMQETFIKERPKPEEEKKLTTMLTAEGGKKKSYIKVTVDDATAFLSKFKSGALGTFEATRFAGGRKNHERIEINGSRGSILFNFEKMNELKYWSKEDELEVQGFRTILVTEEVHPYIKYWWPPGHLIGYQNTFVNEFGDFFQSISKDSKVNPDFYDGWKANQVLDAVSKSPDVKLKEVVRVS